MSLKLITVLSFACIYGCISEDYDLPWHDGLFAANSQPFKPLAVATNGTNSINGGYTILFPLTPENEPLAIGNEGLNITSWSKCTISFVGKLTDNATLGCDNATSLTYCIKFKYGLVTNGHCLDVK